MAGPLDAEELGVLPGQGKSKTAEQKRAAKRELDRRNELSDLRWLLATPEGRRIVTRIMTVCRIDQSSVVTGDPCTTYYNEGLRYAGQWLFNECKEANFTNTFLAIQEDMNKEPNNA